MTITDFINGIAEKCVELIPNVTIYLDEVEQNMQVPAVFIKIRNYAETKVNGKNRYRDDIEVLIKYIPSDTDNASSECFGLLEDFEDLVEFIPFDNDEIMGKGIESNVTDGILNTYVNYSVFVYKVAEKDPLMQKLDIK